MSNSSTATTQLTPYEALDPDKKDIRLLRLLPGAEEDALAGELILSNLKLSQPDLAFEAVSYFWGDKALRAVIHIDGSQIEIPLSASQALKRLRYRDCPRLLWLDSVCIDQSDAAEKSCQVALMHLVYGLASRCLIWLGEEDGTVASAIETIGLLEVEIERATAGDVKLFDVFYTEYRIRRRNPAENFSDNCDIAAVLSLLARPWFKRVWTIQEAALASATICLCGSHEISLTRILRVTTWLMHKRYALLLLGIHTDALWHALMRADIMDQDSGLFRSQGFDGTPLTKLLSTVKSFQADDPHDFIYGVLGMYRTTSSSAELPSELLPDYTKSVAQLFAEVTKLCIGEKQTLVVLKDVIHKAGHPAAVEGLPSWVPSWHQPFALEEEEAYLAPYFDAASGRELQFPDPMNSAWNILRVMGKEAGVVETTSELYHISTFRSFMSQADAIARDSKQLSTRDETTLMRELFRTLLADCNYDYDKATSSDLEDMQEALALLRTSITNAELDFLPHNKHTPAAQGQSIAHRSTRITRACNRACRGRRFFVSKDGRFGLGPADMRVGDFVAILFDANVPYVLRQIDTPDQYELVGGCYVEGVMYGEAMLQNDERRAADRTFNIC